jgi:hypothetical protein
MRERLLGSQKNDSLAMESFDRERDNLLDSHSRPESNQVGTLVKVRLGSLETPKKVKVIQ